MLEIIILLCLIKLLEVICLAILIQYTIKYFKSYKENADPYTKCTLILLIVSITTTVGG